MRIYICSFTIFSLGRKMLVAAQCSNDMTKGYSWFEEHCTWILGDH